MNVIRAVESLQRDGGRIRRAGWRPDEYVTLAGEQPIYHWMRTGAWGEKLISPCPGTCRGQPMAADILADDWIWESEPPRAEPEPSEPLPAGAWERTLTIKGPW
jgi:hypothetical protein